MPGRLSVDAVTAWLNIRVPARSSSATLAGLLLEKLGHIPREGETCRMDDWIMEVRRMDGPRIEEVRAVRHED